MALDAWELDYPAASNFIANRFACEGSLPPSAGFCDAAIDAMIARASQMQPQDPAAAGALWADIERAIVDQAPHLWLVNPEAVG
jgi:ABC-type oligopeptide transport system substrate-binding subunit